MSILNKSYGIIKGKICLREAGQAKPRIGLRPVYQKRFKPLKVNGP
jgi:hypothetical protein